MEVRSKKLPNITGNNWVIGDIHGYVNTFKSLVQKIAPGPDDRVILLGDLVDRGPDVKGVLDAIIQYRQEGIDMPSLRGNHDDLMYKSWASSKGRKGLFQKLRPNEAHKGWERMGGKSTLMSFGAGKVTQIGEEYFRLIEEMYHYLEDDDFLYVHAGFDFKRENPFENVEDMMWIRDFQVDFDKSGGRKVVHGHTPLDIEFIQDVVAHPERDRFIALDNGISFVNMPNKGRLLAYETKSGRLVIQGKQDPDTPF
ncbi:MAG: serine/threonine protein phosphatase [Bacteroidetes bacterium]|jgi:serine/threonine protein phosphatase 1|nr:serine/threonine protein phosphatase [Bacteroidota bacterium]